MEEENKKVETKPKKSSSTTKKKDQEVNNRLLEVVERMEIESKKQNDKNTKNTKNSDESNKNITNRNVQNKNIQSKKITNKKEIENTPKHKNKSVNIDINTKSNSKKTKEEMQLIKANEEFKQIEKAIKTEKKIPKEKMQKIYQKVFENILIAIVMTLYLIFINLGYINIHSQTFITDIKVFSIAIIIMTVVLFEQAYKKESGKLTINGIETLILAIITMLLPEIYKNYNELFMTLVATISFIIGIYYVGKSIIIYIKMKRRFKKDNLKKMIKK